MIFMQELDFLMDLFDRKMVEILRLFLQFPEKKFYLKEVSDSSDVSMASSHRILTKLVKLSVLDEIKISKFKVYQLLKNDRSAFLGSFIKQSVKVLEMFVDSIKNFPGVEMVILHGKEADNKANILIIGENVSKSDVKHVSADLREKYNYTISYLTLTHEQYGQMSEMGLYSGTKKTLYRG